jgi:hypothetical protein
MSDLPMKTQHQRTMERYEEQGQIIRAKRYIWQNRAPMILSTIGVIIGIAVVALSFALVIKYYF